MEMRIQTAFYACVGAFLLSAGGCGGAGGDGNKARGDDDKPARKNVLLIVLDTVRRDKLGCYGSELGATPRIDEFAERGAVFERAYSHAPWTLPATASLLTSQYPPQHGAGGSVPNFRRLPERARTAAECFRDAGYATAEVVNVDFLAGSFGMTQGFEHVDFKAYPSNVQVRPAAPTTDAAIEWLETRGERPFFLLVHYFDAHLVYAPPAEFRKKFADVRDREDDSWIFGTRRQIVGYRQGKVNFGERTIRRAERLYNGEIAYVDQEVGRLLDALGEMRLDGSTIVALTADHGEEFLDHGGFEHGHTLYDELVGVPLIIRDAAGGDGRRVKTRVGHVDVTPTLCELAGVTADPAFVGRSLVDLMNGVQTDERPIVLEGNFWGKSMRGWLSGAFKLIQRADLAIELYAINGDRRERNNLAESNAELVTRLTAEMELAFERMATGKGEEADLTHDELERLKSLGYAGGEDEGD